MKSINKTELRKKLYERDGKKCHYCEIDENKFTQIWGIFYSTRGHKLEIDRKDFDNMEYSLENCVLSCAICNCCKSNKFTYNEFKNVGNTIRQIWNDRLKG